MKKFSFLCTFNTEYMSIQDKFEYWLDIAKYDLETAEAMFAADRWLYVVFMCQQAIKKLSKSITKEEAQSILENTRETFAWLLTLKP